MAWNLWRIINLFARSASISCPGILPPILTWTSAWIVEDMAYWWKDSPMEPILHAKRLSASRRDGTRSNHFDFVRFAMEKVVTRVGQFLFEGIDYSSFLSSINIILKWWKAHIYHFQIDPSRKRAKLPFVNFFWFYLNGAKNY